MATQAWADGGPQAPLGESREQVLRLLRAASRPLGVRDVAGQAGLHPNTARFHLDRLTEAGLAERALAQHAGPGRPRLVYRAAPGPDRGQRSYRLLATMLASLVAAMLPDPGAAALTAGQEWGRYLTDRPAPLTRTSAAAAAAQLTETLTGLGFGAELAAAPGGPLVRLGHCPFREVAEENQDVVCALHLGLMRGVLAELRAPLTAERLEPFAEPNLCLGYLRQDTGSPADPVASR